MKDPPIAAASAPYGLTSDQARRRMERDGPNELPRARRSARWRVVADVVREPMLALLALAAGLYFALGDVREAVVLGISVGVVVAITLFQSMRSERALEALRDLTSPRAAVLRDGQRSRMAARDLVVGDIVLLDEGDRVPADARVHACHALQADESLLTGESAPVAKQAATQASASATEVTTLYSGTLITSGHATAEVVATGPNTAIGRIGKALRDVTLEPTPMQREMNRAVMIFAALGLTMCAVVTVLYGLLRGGWIDALLAGITLAIANIPEEFPVVLTIFLALGAWRMARHRVVTRRAPAIETLGAITVLCADKTGTLTYNRMAIAALDIGERCWKLQEGAPPEAFDALLHCAVLASEIAPFDPMEKAILAARPAYSEGGALIAEYPLGPALLAHTHVWRLPGRQALIVACKGAPEAIAELCNLDPERHAALQTSVTTLAREGLRVIGVAIAELSADATAPATQRGFPFRLLGLIGFADPLREGVAAAVGVAAAAGVRTLMLTGDHPDTAGAIARQAGLPGHAHVVTGVQIDRLDDAALTACLADHDVFARVTPSHKLRIIAALKARGEIVAMTGDGVNDAPALRAAHVGVAMGGRGTDVAREAAALVLLDDDFESIVRAIRLGRQIYDNISRAFRYILAVHVPFTCITLLPLILDGPLVLWPIHIVFLQLVIDPACALVFEREPAASDLMTRPPRPPAERLLQRSMLLSSLLKGAAIASAAAVVYLLAWWRGLPAGENAALTFSSIVIGNLGLITLYRNSAGLRGALRTFNAAYWAIVGLSILALCASLYVPSAQTIFRFATPPTGALLAALLLPLLTIAGFGFFENVLSGVCATRARAPVA